jgi:hypothetical protein
MKKAKGKRQKVTGAFHPKLVPSFPLTPHSLPDRGKMKRFRSNALLWFLPLLLLFQRPLPIWDQGLIVWEQR